MSLDEEVSRLLFFARTMERAVHGYDAWTIACGDHEAPAERSIEEDQVTFVATVPGEWLGAHPVLELRCAGLPVHFRHLVGDYSGTCSLTVEWVLRMRQSASV